MKSVVLAAQKGFRQRCLSQLSLADATDRCGDLHAPRGTLVVCGWPGMARNCLSCCKAENLLVFVTRGSTKSAVHPDDPLEARSLEQTGKIIDRPFPVCFYAFMRTTIELPPDLMRAAKSRSAAQGETLKELVTRALEAELGRSRHVRSTGVRVQLPLFGNPTSVRVAVTNEAIERVLAADDALTRSKKPRRK